MLAWMPTYFTDSLSLDLSHAAQVSLLPPIAAIAASALAGPSADALIARGVPVETVRWGWGGEGGGAAGEWHVRAGLGWAGVESACVCARVCVCVCVCVCVVDAGAALGAMCVVGWRCECARRRRTAPPAPPRLAWLQEGRPVHRLPGPRRLPAGGKPHGGQHGVCG